LTSVQGLLTGNSSGGTEKIFSPKQVFDLLNMFDRDLVHLPACTFDRKRISANSNPKAQKRFGKTKWRHFLDKCPNTVRQRWLTCSIRCLLQVEATDLEALD